MTEEETAALIDEGIDLPHAAVVGFVSWTAETEGTDGEPLSVHALALAFQIEDGGPVARQVFLINSDVVPLVVDALTNAPTHEEIFS